MAWVATKMSSVAVGTSLAPAVVLLRVDEPHGLARRPLLLVQIQLAHDALDQPQLVVGVQNLEVLRQLGVAPVHPQQAVGDAVERADPHGAGGAAEQGFDPAAHFRGGLVREGDRQHAAWRESQRLDQPRDAMHQHPRLAAAGPGNHQQIAHRRRDGVALPVVQALQDVRDVHRMFSLLDSKTV